MGLLTPRNWRSFTLLITGFWAQASQGNLKRVIDGVRQIPPRLQHRTSKLNPFWDRIEKGGKKHMRMIKWLDCFNASQITNSKNPVDGYIWTPKKRMFQMTCDQTDFWFSRVVFNIKLGKHDRGGRNCVTIIHQPEWRFNWKDSCCRNLPSELWVAADIQQKKQTNNYPLQ